MKNRYLALIACASAALLPAAPASAAIVFSFTPSATQIAVGQTVTVDATISGLGSEILSAFDLKFIYSPAVLNWTSDVYNNANLGTTLGLGTLGSAAGSLVRNDSSFDEPDVLAGSQADSFVLFTFSFTGAADGVTTLTLGPDADFERNFVGLDFLTSLNVDVGSVCIGVGTASCDGGNPDVPEPGTLALLGLGLLGVAGMRRRLAA